MDILKKFIEENKSMIIRVLLGVLSLIMFVGIIYFWKLGENIDPKIGYKLENYISLLITTLLAWGVGEVANVAINNFKIGENIFKTHWLGRIFVLVLIFIEPIKFYFLW